MLIDFSFKNYKSFKDEQHFSMRRDTSVELEKDSILGDSLPQEGINRVTAIYGANAAGKTNLLRAIYSLCDNVANGKKFNNNFIADSKESTDYNIVFIANGGVKYSYTIKIAKSDVTYEKLDVYHSCRPTNLFEAKPVSGRIKFSKNIDEKEKIAISYNSNNDLSKSILYLMKNSKNKDIRLARDYFSSSIIYHDSPKITPNNVEDDIKNSFMDYPRIKDCFNGLVPSADFGVKKVEIVEDETGLNKKEMDIVADAILKINEISNKGLSRESKAKIREEIISRSNLRASFLHEIDKKIFDFRVNKESNGTIAASSIFLKIIPVLEMGASYLVDEIDCSLHPILVAELIEIFNCKETNPKNAQLIFTTHDISLLDPSLRGENLLDRDQVWFAEKDRNGKSSIYPLTSIKKETRKNDNYYKKYIEGRYGATPRISLFYEVQKYWEKEKKKK